MSYSKMPPRSPDVGRPLSASWRAVVCCATLAVGGCYRNAAQQAGRLPSSPSPVTTLTVVEADDRGAFWNAEQPMRALEEVRAAAAQGSVAVVLFIHGWGHSAAPDDQNYLCFERTIDHLGRRLNSGTFRTLMANMVRQQGGSAPLVGPLKVVGIYVGWRGKSLPEAPGPLGILSRAPTFWARKSAAARVGRGDLRSFIDELSAIYDAKNSDAPGLEATAAGRIFSLVMIGHSFGGQVLFPAVASRLEDQLQGETGDLAWRALRGLPVTAQSKSFVKGMGDIVVLVNPAMEASAYERMYRLERQLTFANAQTPALTVFSADNDVPRHYVFPLGRFFSTALTPSSEAGQRERDLIVLGRHDPQVTHRLEFSADSAAVRDRGTTNESASVQRRLGCDLPPQAESSAHDQLYQAIKRDASSADPTGDVWIDAKHLFRTDNMAQPYAPLMVVRTGSREVIDGHNGFFNPEFVDFLVRYVTDIEAKRFGTTLARRQLASTRR